MVTPTLAALEVEAPRTECALNNVLSIPDRPRTSFSHLATVDEVIGPYGFINEMKSCFSSFLKGPVLSRYYFNVATGHKF